MKRRTLKQMQQAAASRERELEAQLDDERAKVRGLRAELGLAMARVELAEARVAELERDAKRCACNMDDCLACERQRSDTSLAASDGNPKGS